jgi:hypothetical protein
MKLHHIRPVCIAIGIIGCASSTVSGGALGFFWSPSGQLPNSGPWSSPGHRGTVDLLKNPVLFR